MSALHEDVRQAQAFEANAYQNLDAVGVEVGVAVDQQQAESHAAQMIADSTFTTNGARGRLGTQTLNTNELAYKLERLSETSPADAIGARMVMDQQLDSQQLGDLNRALGDGRSMGQQIELGLSHPVQGLIGAAKGIANGFSAAAELALEGMAYQSVGDQYQRAAFQSLYDTEGSEQTLETAEQMYSAADAIDVPEFATNNGAQAGGELLGMALDVASAGKGLVGGGARVLLRSGDELTEVVVRQSDELVGSVSRSYSGREAVLSSLDIPQGLSIQQFDEVSNLLRTVAQSRGLGTDIFIQGSRADGTARASSDLDIGIRLSPQQFDEFLNNGSKIANPNPGSAASRTREHAITTGKIQSGEARLSSVRVELEASLGMDVDLSIIKSGGMFDIGSQLPILQID